MSQQARLQSSAEEWANSLSHGLGFLGAVVACPLLVVATLDRGKPFSLLGTSIFGASMLLLYFTSSIYHGLPEGRLKQIFLKLDLGAIYVFIAGSYTPFALSAADSLVPSLPGLMLTWGCALIGVSLNTFNRLTHPHISSGLYLLMGWLVLIAAYPLVAQLNQTSWAWLIAGGVIYTLGVGFYLADWRIRYGHCIWHVFVMGGSTCHYLAVFYTIN